MADNKPHPFFTHRRRAVIAERVRRYHSSKIHPKRAKVVIEEDLGKVKQITAISFPPEVQPETKVIPANPNPDLVKLFSYPFKLIQYKTSGRYFMYSSDGEFIAELEAHDLLNLWLSLLKHFGRFHVHRRRGRVELCGRCRKWLLTHI